MLQVYSDFSVCVGKHLNGSVEVFFFRCSFRGCRYIKKKKPNTAAEKKISIISISVSPQELQAATPACDRTKRSAGHAAAWLTAEEQWRPEPPDLLLTVQATSCRFQQLQHLKRDSLASERHQASSLTIPAPSFQRKTLCRNAFWW